jgi:hypothetical protein
MTSITSWGALLACALAFATAYTVSMWHLGMDDSERSMLRGPLEKLTSTLRRGKEQNE